MLIELMTDIDEFNQVHSALPGGDDDWDDEDDDEFVDEEFEDELEDTDDLHEIQVDEDLFNPDVDEEDDDHFPDDDF